MDDDDSDVSSAELDIGQTVLIYSLHEPRRKRSTETRRGVRAISYEHVTLHFKKASGEVETVEANVGDDIVDVSWEYDLDIEAACEKSIACSTCHVILEPDVFDSLPEPSDDENDMLDLAFGLEDTSRLGCQVHVTKEMDGTTITLPSATRNMRVDGSKPTPH